MLLFKPALHRLLRLNADNRLIYVARSVTRGGENRPSSNNRFRSPLHLFKGLLSTLIPTRCQPPSAFYSRLPRCRQRLNTYQTPPYPHTRSVLGLALGAYWGGQKSYKRLYIYTLGIPIPIAPLHRAGIETISYHHQITT